MTFTVSLRSSSPEGTREIGRVLGESAWPGLVFAIYGDLGAGKTVLVQGLADGIGVENPIASPTFVLMIEYQGRVPFSHADLYRLDGRLDDELLDSLLDAADAGVLAVEWPETLMPALPRPATVVRIAVVDEQTRRITVEFPTPHWVEAFQTAAEAR